MSSFVFPKNAAWTRLPLGEEPVGDPALVEDLDGARVESARTRAHQFRRRAALHDRRVHSRQGQLCGEHHPGRAAAGNDHIGHRNHQLSKLPVRLLPGTSEPVCGITGGLPQALCCAIHWKWRGPMAPVAREAWPSTGPARPRNHGPRRWRNRLDAFDCFEAPGPNRLGKGLVVLLVLVRVTLGEIGNGVVEFGALAQIGGDRDRVT